MRNLITVAIAFLLAATASADLASNFAQLRSKRKGPFDVNTLQGSISRVAIATPLVQPEGNFQFQAAFRNEPAKILATQNNFYVGNLFTTNYYELMGEYVYNDIYGSHELDHAALLTNGAAARAKATTMLQNWVLEKHYTSKLPQSHLANAFKLRGISGTEFEQQYAGYFFNFYLSIIEDDFQYLATYLLAKQSPISSSSTLEQARNLIAVLYDELNAPYLAAGTSAPASILDLYRLRNMIHNQLSSNAVEQMDAFATANPSIGADARFSQVRTILVEYFNIDASKVVAAARRAGARSIRTLAEQMVASGGNTSQYLALSQELARLRTSIMSNTAIATERKTENLVLIIKTAQYLNKQLGALTRVDSKDTFKTVLNLIYAEGFLIKDNADYFQAEIDAAQNLNVASLHLTDVIDVAAQTLTEAFTPAYAQWLSIEPQMESFSDNTIKSSALSTAAQIITKVRGH